MGEEVKATGRGWCKIFPGVQISAKKGQGIDDLLETLLLVAEIEQLTANPARMARYCLLSPQRISACGLR